jgi:hypothetical protein
MSLRGAGDAQKHDGEGGKQGIPVNLNGPERSHDYSVYSRHAKGELWKIPEVRAVKGMLKKVFETQERLPWHAPVKQARF